MLVLVGAVTDRSRWDGWTRDDAESDGDGVLP